MAEYGDDWGEEYGGPIATIDTHEQDAQNRLIFRYQNAANMKAVQQIFAERWQQIENVLADIITLFDLDTAADDWQDKLGQILNVARSGFDDADYRNLQLTKANAVIPGRRTVEGLLAIARALLGPKTLAGLGPQRFAPVMSTLTDAITTLQGVPVGTSYVAATDARDFDGIDDTVTWPSIAVLTALPISIAYRVRDDDLAAPSIHFRIGPGTAFRIQAQPGGAIRVQIAYSVTNLIVDTAAAAITEGVEHHITVTYDGTGLAAGVTIAIDGFAVTPAFTQDSVGVASSLAGDWTIGSSGAASFLLGAMRTVFAYDSKLSGPEILTLFRGGERFIDFIEHYPKAFVLTLEGVTTEEEITFREFLRVARPATYNGVVLIVPTPAFGFDDSTGAVTVSKLGYDNASAPPSFGGPMAHVLPL